MRWGTVCVRAVCVWRAAGGGRVDGFPTCAARRNRRGWCLMLGVVPMMQRAWVWMCGVCV